METEDSLPLSQNLTNFAYPDPDQFNLIHTIVSLQDPS
jgi:hypothetical protein